MTTTTSTSKIPSNPFISYKAEESNKAEESKASCLSFALATIVLIGGLVATGYFQPKIGAAAYAFGGGGLVISVVIVAACSSKNPKMLREERDNLDKTSHQNLQNQQKGAPVPSDVKKNPWDVSGTKWLDNVKINQYIITLAVKHPELFIAPSPSVIVPGKGDFLDLGLTCSINETFKEALKDDVHSVIAIPLVVSGNHSTLLIIDKQRRTVEYYDSKVNYGNYDEIECELKEIALKLSSEEPNQKPYQYQQKTTKCLQPYDGYQCGIWILYFLKRRLEEPDFDFNTLDVDDSQSMIQNFRIQVNETLKEMLQYDEAVSQFYEEHGDATGYNQAWIGAIRKANQN